MSGDFVHTFTSSGTFTVSSGSTNAGRVLLVGGGGGGGCNYLGGGGGGGGVVDQSGVSLSPQAYSVTVGGGGSGCGLNVSRNNVDGFICVQTGDGRSPGSASSFSTLVANGGGGGGSYFVVCNNDQCKCAATATTSGQDGGSGGGSHWFGSSGGNGTPGQGNSGGDSIASDAGPGGGGGAGNPGDSGQPSYMGGNGGDGVASDISGVSTYYGGGGAGASGGFLPAGCFKMIGSSTSQSSVTITGLAPNTTYYYRVVPEWFFTNSANEDEYQKCSTVGAITPSCIASLNPSTITVPEGSSGSFTTTVTGNSGTTTVNYSSVLPYFSFNPAVTSDSTSLYLTTVSALQQTAGSQQFTASVTDEAANSCTAIGSVTVTAPENPWWQVIDSDVQANGDLISTVPVGDFFGLPGGGGFPGVAAYGDTTNLASDNVSETYGWLANSPLLSGKVFKYDYFANLVPTDVEVKTIASEGDMTGATPDIYGYEWYKYDGAVSGIPLAIDSALALGNRKVILLVEAADLNISSTINLTKGAGFFFAVVNGNITVDPSVGGAGAALEGIYEADGVFSSGTTGAGDDVQLHVRGSVAAYGGVNLQRDLTSNASPAELFEYAPDQILLYPTSLGYRKLNWKEVAP